MTDAPGLIVAGPTCTGKSALALGLAERFNGTVINADSMQVYRDLRILTARPGPEEEARAPHRLYGVRPAACPGDVAWWRAAAIAAMEEARSAGRLPILCGGSGLYLAALTGGLAPIPPVDAATRAEARELLARIGPEALHGRLAAADPETAARLRPSDGQRIARAWEVWRSSGVGLAAWQARPPTPAAWRFAAFLLTPDRAWLQRAVAGRFVRMLQAGALDEVRGLLRQGLANELPIMRALGVPELAAHLRGAITLHEASERAVLATRRYAKRQSTWFRHHALAPARNVHALTDFYQQYSESITPEIVNIVDAHIDAPQQLA